MSTSFKKRPARRREVARHDHPGRTSFVAFIRHVRPGLYISQQIRLLARKVERALVHKEGWLRLILVWPPRTGKTTAGSVLLLAWVFGLHPDWEAIVGSLSGKLASKIGAKIRQIIDSKRFAEVFGEVGISKHTAAKTEFAVTHRTPKGEDGLAEGYFFASGRNTRATGQGSHLLLFDDLIGEKEADSRPAIEDAEEAIQMWRSRGAPSGFHWIINNTRYREDDPIGHILSNYANDGPWDVVILPSMVEIESEEGDFELDDGTIWCRRIGEVIWPYSLNVEQFMATRAGLLEHKPHEWYGQHKGKPKPPQGRLLDRNDLQLYEEAPTAIRARCDRVAVIVDTARKAEEKNDPSGILVVGQWQNRHYVLYALAKRLEFLDLCAHVARICQEWRPHRLIVESSANGTALVNSLRRLGHAVEIQPSGKKEEVPFNTACEEVNVPSNQGSKVMRFDAVVPPTVRQHLVWLSRGAPWREELSQQLADFPRVAHDDLCDALAIWLKWTAEHSVASLSAPSPPAGLAKAAANPARPQPREQWTRLR